MEHENDKTIFNYLNPMDNDILSSISKKDLEDILNVLNKYYLEFRDKLGLSFKETFGIEIEIENYIEWGKFKFFELPSQLSNVLGNGKWDVRNDLSLYQGREFVSPILTDKKEDWESIKMACEFSSAVGKIDVNCASHIHGGAQILGENYIYWYRFFKLWSIYENVIYRFFYGEYLTNRPKMLKYARPAASFLDERLKLLKSNTEYKLIDMLRIIEPKGVDEKYTKNFGISYWRMLADDNYDLYEDFNKMNDGCTLECRVPNPTLDEIVWQNNINFFIKLMLFCKSDKFNDDILDRRKKEVFENFSNLPMYSNIYLEQAIELSDMIFDNNLDKLYFLRQYVKSFDVDNKSFIKTRKFTNK